MGKFGSLRLLYCLRLSLSCCEWLLWMGSSNVGMCCSRRDLFKWPLWTDSITWAATWSMLQKLRRIWKQCPRLQTPGGKTADSFTITCNTLPCQLSIFWVNSMVNVLLECQFDCNTSKASGSKYDLCVTTHWPQMPINAWTLTTQEGKHPAPYSSSSHSSSSSSSRPVLGWSGGDHSVSVLIIALWLQGGLHGTLALQGADQGLCLITSTAHDTWSCFSQYPVHARGKCCSSRVVLQCILP